MAPQMSGEVQLAFDYGALDPETRRYVRERAEHIHQLARRTAAGIVEIGRDLTEVKAKLKHGQFLEWIDKEFAWKERSARNFMSVYENVTPHLKSATVADLQVEFRALYLIAAPSTPEPVRAEAIRRAETGERVTHATVQAVVAAYEETGDAPTAIGKLFDVVKTAQRQEAEERKALPSPTEARRIAVETGAHTLDRNGTYQPPMTVNQQEAWRADWRRISPIADFLRWVAETGSALDAGELVTMIEARGWRKDFTRSPQAAEWLTTFTTELICRRSQTLQTSET